MKVAQTPKNENERLQALFEYDVLDTEAETVFDDLTDLASEICNTPISLISLIDPERQWFKSKHGLGVDCTSRDIAFCSHAILQDDVFEVQNTLKDERFFDNPLVTTDPNIRFYAGTPLTTPSGFNIGTLCVISDTPKKLNKSQKKALVILGREVIAQLELRINNKKLEVANKYKTEFLSNVSHEIRTPLNAIIGLSELILHDKALKDAFSEHYAFVEQIDFSGKRLLNIINSILDLSKIEAGKMELDPVHSNIGNYIDKLFLSLSGKAADKNLVFSKSNEINPEKSVIIDESKLGQILTNIIGNAIKFTSRNHGVNLLASAVDNRLCLTVIDQGIGISDEDQVLLFDKYAQVGKNNSDVEGTGLGLSITKGLVDLMGGDIQLKSEVGVGTTITVTIPFKEHKSSKASNEFDVNLKNIIFSNLSILVVEDNKVNQVVIMAMLKSLDIKATVVGSGEDALEDIKHNSYDIILMDINLPGIDGIETTRRMKKGKVTSQIIALTADVYRTSREKKLFNNFLTKPILLDDLKLALSLAQLEIKAV